MYDRSLALFETSPATLRVAPPQGNEPGLKRENTENKENRENNKNIGKYYIWFLLHFRDCLHGSLPRPQAPPPRGPGDEAKVYPSLIGSRVIFSCSVRQGWSKTPDRFFKRRTIFSSDRPVVPEIRYAESSRPGN